MLPIAVCGGIFLYYLVSKHYIFALGAGLAGYIALKYPRHAATAVSRNLQQPAQASCTRCCRQGAHTCPRTRCCRVRAGGCNHAPARPDVRLQPLADLPHLRGTRCGRGNGSSQTAQPACRCTTASLGCPLACLSAGLGAYFNASEVSKRDLYAACLDLSSPLGASLHALRTNAKTAAKNFSQQTKAAAQEVVHPAQS